MPKLIPVKIASQKFGLETDEFALCIFFRETNLVDI